MIGKLLLIQWMTENSRNLQSHQNTLPGFFMIFISRKQIFQEAFNLPWPFLLLLQLLAMEGKCE